VIVRGADDRVPDGLAGDPLHLATAMRFSSSLLARQSLDAPPGERMAYRRHGNPTVHALEQALSALHGGAHCLTTSSGMGACVLVFSALLRAGDHVVCLRSAFYEISEVLQHIAGMAGIGVSAVSGNTIDRLMEACTASTRMVFVESPSNPGLVDVDLVRLATRCRARGILLVVDNTVLTPLGQDVLALGAHISVLSLSKHMGGHGDVIGGMVATHDRRLFELLETWRACSGQGLDPFAAWLLLRSLHSLVARLRQHAANARHVGRMLNRQHPWLAWRGAWTGPHARRNGVSRWLHTGLMAFLFEDALQAGRFVDALHDIHTVATFGNPASSVYHYGGVFAQADALDAIEVPAGLVRLSVGLEHPQDIVADILQALDHCR